MPYIAHAGIQLSEDYTAYEKNRWYFIKSVQGVNFHWRINDKGVYEVICEMIANKAVALFAAKNIYVTALYNLLYKGIKIDNAGCDSYAKSIVIPGTDENADDYPECTFFWTPQCLGGGIGPDVYEVPEKLDDFDKIYGKWLWGYLDSSVSTTATVLAFDNYEKSFFMYSEMTQPLLNTVIQADSTFEIGLRMTLYCGLLEHMAEDIQKNPNVILEIDALVEHVKSSSLTKEEKSSLVSYLNSGKTISSKQKCKLLCQQYAKERYGPYSTKQILDDAYSIRSAFSHGEDCSKRYSGPGPYIKLVVLEVMIGYVKKHDIDSTSWLKERIIYEKNHSPQK